MVAPDELLPVARTLATDMLSCDPATMRGYLKLIDDGYDAPFGEAMELERRRSNDHSRDLAPDTIAERRRAIQDRGRRQSQA